jgi:hypothetical protein
MNLSSSTTTVSSPVFYTGEFNPQAGPTRTLNVPVPTTRTLSPQRALLCCSAPCRIQGSLPPSPPRYLPAQSRSSRRHTNATPSTVVPLSPSMHSRSPAHTRSLRLPQTRRDTIKRLQPQPIPRSTLSVNKNLLLSPRQTRVPARDHLRVPRSHLTSTKT